MVWKNKESALALVIVGLISGTYPARRAAPGRNALPP